MLVLSVDLGGTITIGENVVVHCLGLKSNGTVRLGFEAPAEIPIVRGDAINKEPKIRDENE